ncbi:unnamed protein product [Somion occarium]|uniref:Uncharacterized protein n=1 Tax=Somion occarium TaxID=3059160 RepID=A0ABP1DZS6_9APHY
MMMIASRDRNHKDGLDAWKCRRCSKRVAGPSTAPATSVTASRKQADQLQFEPKVEIKDVKPHMGPIVSTSHASLSEAGPSVVKAERKQAKNDAPAMAAPRPTKVEKKPAILVSQHAETDYIDLTESPAQPIGRTSSHPFMNHHVSSAGPSSQQRNIALTSYRDQARSPSLSSYRSSSIASTLTTPSNTASPRSSISRGPSTPFAEMSIKDRSDPIASTSRPREHLDTPPAPRQPLREVDQSKTSAALPYVGGKVDISALVRTLRAEGKLNAPPSYLLDATRSTTIIPTRKDPEFVIIDNDIKMREVNEDIRDSTPRRIPSHRDTMSAERSTRTPSARSSESGSMPPVPLGLAPEWMRQMDADRQKGERDDLDRLLAKSARVRQRQYQEKSETTARRKPVARRLGPKGRKMREAQGVQFLVREWISENKHPD